MTAATQVESKAKGKTQKKSSKKPDGRSYWEKRKNSVYLHAARVACAHFGGKPRSVIDVGSNGTPTLEWHRETAARLVSVDLKNPYVAAGVESIKSDFLKFETPEPFDLVTCFQVLEHVPDPGAFAKKLLSLGEVVVVSVPYKWPKGRCKYHPNDPVDEAKLLRWFGRKPSYSHLSIEIPSKEERLIQIYSSRRTEKREKDERRKARPSLLVRVKRAVTKRLRGLAKSARS